MNRKNFIKSSILGIAALSTGVVAQSSSRPPATHTKVFHTSLEHSEGYISSIDNLINFPEEFFMTRKEGYFRVPVYLGKSKEVADYVIIEYDNEMGYHFYLESNPSLKNKQAVSRFSMKDGLPLKWISFIFE